MKLKLPARSYFSRSTSSFGWHNAVTVITTRGQCRRTWSASSAVAWSAAISPTDASHGAAEASYSA